MAFVGKRLKVNGVVYTPQSSLPSNPVEGQLYYSDGTASTEALYVYKNGAWVDLSSSTNVTVTTKTTTYTATTADNTILADTSGGAWTLTLPTASGNSGKEFVIKKTTSDTNDLTIDGNGSETIDGQTTATIQGQYSFLKIVSDGTNWQIIGFQQGVQVEVVGQGSSSNSITANTTNITFTEVTDVTSSWNGSEFVAPYSGYYTISGNMDFTTSSRRIPVLYRNTGGGYALYRRFGADITSSTQEFGGTVYLDKGDSIALRVDQNGGTLGTSTTAHWIHIQNATPSQIS